MKNLLPYKPRILNYLYAYIFGYFWLPCPICDKNFGGHESGESLMSSAFRGECVCFKCGAEADKRNKEREKEFDRQMNEHYSQSLKFKNE